jgi:hypothetical protein
MRNWKRVVEIGAGSPTGDGGTVVGEGVDSARDLVSVARSDTEGLFSVIDGFILGIAAVAVTRGEAVAGNHGTMQARPRCWQMWRTAHCVGRGWWVVRAPLRLSWRTIGSTGASSGLSRFCSGATFPCSPTSLAVSDCNSSDAGNIRPGLSTCNTAWLAEADSAPRRTREHNPTDPRIM